MNELETLFGGMNQDTLYWVIGTIGLVLFVALIFAFRRVARGRTVGTEGHLPSGQAMPAPRSSESAAVQGSPVNSMGEAQSIHDILPAQELSRAGAPASDLPADLDALPKQQIPIHPEVPPATIEEIQRPTPKPLFSALSNTRDSFFGRIKSVFGSKPALDPNELEDLEEILYTSDLGPQTVQRLLEAVEDRVKSDKTSGFEAIRDALKSEMLEIFEGVDGAQTEGNGHGNGHGGNGSAGVGKTGHLHVVTSDDVAGAIHHGSEDYIEGLERLAIWSHKPAVLMVVGVNGAGKTTTIGKLARRIAQSGRKVLVAAGDTFRAAAGDQLKVWTERAQVEIFSPEGVTDPSAVAFMACETGRAKAFDVVIIDTAGRLHTQKNLMEELKKMKRVITKQIPDAPHETLLVLDANSGQNALMQAREFHQALGVTGVVLTKLDGSAKGGVAVGLACELQLPIKLIGVGEGIDDLRRFSSREFVDSII